MSEQPWIAFLSGICSSSPISRRGLLHVDTAALSSVAKKAIIRDALTGLADLHDEHIIHTGQCLPYRVMACVLT